MGIVKKLLIFIILGVVTYLLQADNKEAQTPVLPKPNIEVDLTPLDRSVQGRSSYADVLEGVIPTVVSVSSSKIVNYVDSQSRRKNLLEEFFRNYYGLPPSDTEQEVNPRQKKVPSGMGSGVIVTSDGYILTNNHVIATDAGGAADEVVVRLEDGREFETKIVGRDAKTDVAVLKIEAENLPYITLADSDASRVGDVVFAIGNPLRVGLTVTNGIISATQRTNLGILGIEGYENFIQVDAPINLGNSGGPLVDSQGRLIGINTAILSRSGGNIGIGFAIPSNLARRIMLNLIETGKVPRGLLGVRVKSLDQDLVEAFELSTTKGALVHEVQKGLPAEVAGIRHGDVIVALDGRPIESASDLRLRISQTTPGTTVEINFIRNGEEGTIEVTLADLEGIAEGSTEIGETPLIPGVHLKKLDAQLREQYNIGSDIKGLVITQTEPDSEYGRSLPVGMVITEINGIPVDSLSGLKKNIRSGINRFYVWSRGYYAFVVVRIP